MSTRRSIRLAKKEVVAEEPLDLDNSAAHHGSPGADAKRRALAALDGPAMPHGAKKRKRSDPSVQFTVEVVHDADPAPTYEDDLDDSRASKRSKPNGRGITQLEAMLEEFDLEVRTRAEQLEALSEKLVLDIKNTLHVQLMRIPQKIRFMTMADFTERYAGNATAAAAESTTQRLLAAFGEPVSMRKPMGGDLFAERTPLGVLMPSLGFGPNAFSAAVSQTPQGTYSRRGNMSTVKRMQRAAGTGVAPASVRKAVTTVPASVAKAAVPAVATAASAFDFADDAAAPVAATGKKPKAAAVPKTTARKRGAPGAGATEATVKKGRLALAMDDGTQMYLDSPTTRSTLTSDAKAAAVEKVNALQVQLSDLLSQLKS